MMMMKMAAVQRTTRQVLLRTVAYSSHPMVHYYSLHNPMQMMLISVEVIHTTTTTTKNIPGQTYATPTETVQSSTKTTKVP